MRHCSVGADQVVTSVEEVELPCRGAGGGVGSHTPKSGGRTTTLQNVFAAAAATFPFAAKTQHMVYKIFGIFPDIPISKE